MQACNLRPQNFYYCFDIVNAQAWYYTCSVGTVFNENTKSCDWPSNVVCQPQESECRGRAGGPAYSRLKVLLKAV